MPADRSVIRNGILFPVVAATYFVYMRFVANTLPDGWGGEVNVIVAPFLLGIICTFAFAGRVLVRAVLLVAAAAFVLLIITGDGDPAKPGLHLWVAGAMVLVALLGMLCTSFVMQLLKRGKAQR